MKILKYNFFFLRRQIAACIIAASFHIAVGLSMAYSAVLIPNLEKEDAEVHATKSETSWIGEFVILTSEKRELHFYVFCEKK